MAKSKDTDASAEAEVEEAAEIDDADASDIPPPITAWSTDDERRARIAYERTL